MLNSFPLVRLLLPFVIGIVVAIYLPSNAIYPFYAFTFLFILTIISLLIKNYNLKYVFGILVHINLLLAGYSLTSFKAENKIVTNNNSNDNQFIIAEISEPIVVKEKSIKAILTIKGIKSKQNWLKSEGRAIIYLQKDSLSIQLKANDIIAFEPMLKDVPPPQNPNEFDFRNYLAYHLIYQQAYLKTSNWTILKKANNLSIFAWASETRKNLINKLENLGIKDDRLHVASALILGYKDDIDAQLKNAYSSAGAMHVLAVSGLHVGIIFLIFNQLLLFLHKIKYGKYIQGVLLILILWIYALLTGLSPSVMRAATMFSFIVGAKMTNRNSNFFNTLAASALTLLLFNPLLIMEVGFQLSYLAVIGIVVIQPLIYNLYYTKSWLLDKIWELTAVSIAAQIATFPLGLYYFHQFPNYFLLSNLIVIPLAIGILYLGLLVLALSPIPVIASFLAKVLDYVILFLNKIVIYIDELPYSLSQNIKFTLLDNYLIYITIILVILLINLRKYIYFSTASICVILLLGLRLWGNYNELNQKVFTVYNIPQHTSINFIDGSDNILVSDFKMKENKSKLLFHVQNNWIQKGVESEKIINLNKLTKRNQLSNLYTINSEILFNKEAYFQFYDKKIVLITNNFQLPKVTKPLKLDYLIITQNTKHKIKDLTTVFQPKKIIIDASNSNFITKKLKTEAEELNINYWSVPDNGAFEIYF